MAFLFQNCKQYLRAEVRESRGCCIVAVQDIEQDTVVVQEDGLAICPESDYVKFVCDHCFESPNKIDWLSGEPVMAIEWCE